MDAAERGGVDEECVAARDGVGGLARGAGQGEPPQQMAFCGEPVLHAPGARGGPVAVRRGLWSWYAEPREVVGAVRGVTEVGQLAHVGRVCEFVVQRLEVFLLAAGEAREERVCGAGRQDAVGEYAL